MVEAILAAATRVLVTVGYEAATTNRIAEAAGVSVGSLYQYFPSKEAIVAVLLDRHADAMWQTFAAHVTALRDQPVARAVPLIIDALMECHRVEPRLHRVLHEQVPRVGRLARQRDMCRRARAVAAPFLAAHRDEIDVADVDLAAFVLVEAVEALIHAGSEEPDVDPDRLRREMTQLVLRYLGVQKIAAAVMKAT